MQKTGFLRLLIQNQHSNVKKNCIHAFFDLWVNLPELKSVSSTHVLDNYKKTPAKESEAENLPNLPVGPKDQLFPFDGCPSRGFRLRSRAQKRIFRNTWHLFFCFRPFSRAIQGIVRVAKKRNAILRV